MQSKSLEAITAEWPQHPFEPAWVEWVRRTQQAIEKRDAGSPAAWRQLAMIFGDSGAPELCAVAAMQGRGLSLEVGDEAAAMSAWTHANLALRDLKVLPTDGSDLDAVHAWLEDFLASLGGDVSQGAEHCLGLALIRAELIERPEELSVETVRALSE